MEAAFREDGNVHARCIASLLERCCVANIVQDVCANLAVVQQGIPLGSSPIGCDLRPLPLQRFQKRWQLLSYSAGAFSEFLVSAE